jgi:integrase
MRFTKTAIENLTLPAGKNEWIAWDDDLPGFGCRVRATSKAWRIQYRVDRRQRSESLGDIRKVSLEDARKIARQRFAQVELGVDPAAEKAKARIAAAAAAVTLGVLTDRYVHAKQHSWRPRTYDEATRCFRIHWSPLRDRPLDMIKRADIALRLQELIEPPHGRVAAARARSHLSACFAWAMREGTVEANPVLGTNDPDKGVPSRERVLSDRELAAIWSVCADDEFGAIIKLLALTGCRRDEIGALKWSELDFDTGVMTLPPERTKNGRTLSLPLPEQAIAILRAVPRRDGNAHVFGRAGFTSWSVATKKLLARIAASGAPQEPWTIHDLRRTMRTGLGRLGVRPDVAEMCINHVRKGMIAVYDRYTYQGEIAAALARWAEHVMAVVEGRKDKIVALRA